MILDAEHRGVLASGGTIVEATAGNTGLGLALVAAVRGYRCIFVLPDKMSEDKVRLLRAYGAEVVITPTNVPPDSPESYNGVADRLAREIVGAWRPNQFANLANPQAHYNQTGPEIWEQTEGKVTVFVASAGTGGTISGVGRLSQRSESRNQGYWRRHRRLDPEWWHSRIVEGGGHRGRFRAQHAERAGGG
jgi:cystathionine beta-synthase